MSWNMTLLWKGLLHQQRRKFTQCILVSGVFLAIRNIPKGILFHWLNCFCRNEKSLKALTKCDPSILTAQFLVQRFLFLRSVGYISQSVQSCEHGIILYDWAGNIRPKHNLPYGQRLIKKKPSTSSPSDRHRNQSISIIQASVRTYGTQNKI